MHFRKIGTASAAAFLLLAGTASAQFLHAGNPDVTALADMTSGGQPSVMTIEGLSDISDYAFDGSDLTVNFSLNGSGATVWLQVYTSGQNPPLTIEGEGMAPYKDPEHDTPGWHVYDGVDYLVYKSAGERMDEGDNSIVWNGRDMNGDVVSAGSYTLHLAAFDDEAVPHLVAGSVFRKLGTPGRPYWDLAREQIFDFRSVNDMNNDWVENFEGFDVMDLAPVADAGGGTPNSAVWLNDDFTEAVAIGQNNFLERLQIDWDANRVSTVEDWGEDFGGANGVINVEDLGASAGQRTITSNPAKTIAYVTAGVSGTEAQLAGYSIATGEKVSSWDMTDLFMYDNKGADRVSGPMETAAHYDGAPDPSGITTTSHHASVIARHSYEGKLLWANRNGDGFGETQAYNSADGTFGDLVYGHTEAPNFKYSLFSAPDGWVSVCENGRDNTSFGAMLGADGSGLFKFEPKNAPLTWSQYVCVVDAGTAWDGLHMQIGGFGDAVPSNDWVSNDVNVPPTHPLVWMPYDQQKVSLGSPVTAVAEAGGLLPKDYEVSDAYPNPFNPETTVRFSLPWEADVRVTVYNDQGQKIATLADERLSPGNFNITWDGRDDNGAQVATGVYLYLIEAPGLRLNKKVTLLK
ncbi:MAG: FlgD immunoglobulin-like domain containing protein [Candidatus Latescibacterota bacterium]|nr:FlgD immunoglobulin-like domain containing protein [Candidatus Latescibacterota bacterium]